jgi:hypothetical protein
MDKMKEFVAYQSPPSVDQILVMKEYTDVSITLMMMRMRIAEQKKLKPLPLIPTLKTTLLQQRQ